MNRVWLDGRLLEAQSARIDPADRGFLLGDGVFETLRAAGGQARHLPRHLARLRHGAGVLGIALPWTDAEIARAAAAVLAGHAEAALRITLSRGPAPRGVLAPPGLAPTLLIAAAPLPLPLPPAHAVVARLTRRNEHSPLAAIKSLNYLDSILARQEAARRGADEAVLLNTAGAVAEASAGNLFVLQDGVWLTPPAGSGALPGIARALLLESGLAEEGAVRLERVEAAFVSSSLGLRALASLDGRAMRGLDLARARQAVLF